MKKTVIITGAAGGIGPGLSKHMAALGWKVGMIDRNPAIQEIAKEINGEVATAVCDIRDSEQVDSAIENIENILGPIHALVNNAGIVANISSTANMSDKRWNNELAVNLSAPFYFIRRLAPKMAMHGWGRIINISSAAARSGLPAQIGYAATKSALWGITSTTAAEFGAKGITCNSILPGLIATPTVLSMPQHILDNANQSNALKRIGEIEEVAHLVAFLCSEGAGYITGAEIDIDGGYRLNNRSLT